ncbi:zinc finger protein 668-like isoform X1 [Lethenteron reissneri]|uniref:zinc finger protein 668-like isoform X1 n=2 Tax=Lethenteron reissneri TaxID=7753 RepID=UPI002AB68BA0|nr:zinc finger protein 668-like isoform X1 [Lethenteron reissneri]
MTSRRAGNGDVTTESPESAADAERNGAEMKFFCPICKWLVVNLPALDDHMKRHKGWTEPALFRCPHCPFKTYKLSVFIGHQATHDARESHKCAECGKVFIDAEVFREHRAAHAEEIPYICADCGKIFARSDTLVAHRRVHEGGRACRCSACGKEFADSRALHIHQNVHGLPSRPPSGGEPEGASAQTFDAPAPRGNGGGGGEPRRRRTSGGGGGDHSFSTGARQAKRNVMPPPRSRSAGAPSTTSPPPSDGANPAVPLTSPHINTPARISPPP